LKIEALGDFKKFVTKVMYFRHILAKIQHKNLKQRFDWGVGVDSNFKGFDFGSKIGSNRLRVHKD